MKILITGVNGQLGYDLSCQLIKNNFDIIGTDINKVANERLVFINSKNFSYTALDITKKEDVYNVVRREHPDAVIHCAAWTNVDMAEKSQNKKFVKLINVDGTKNIAVICEQLKIKLVFISTDYVFNGEGNLPWEPDCKNVDPLNYYGYSKLMAEQLVEKIVNKHFIVRISWAFGINGKNFVRTILELSKKMKVIKVVNDQIGNPTYTKDVSKFLMNLLVTEKYGYYHVTNEGEPISWYEFACEIVKQSGNIEVEIVPISSCEYNNQCALRPLNSRLSKDKLKKEGFKLLPTWQNALKRYLEELRNEN